MKALRFIINTNIFLALTSVCLALATLVQLGLPMAFKPYLLVVFFSTLFDYNLHRFIFVFNKPGALKSEKYKWDAENVNLLKILIVSSITGLVISLFFVGREVLFVMAPLAFLSFLYSVPSLKMVNNKSGLLGLTTMKTFILAFIWAAATVFIPATQVGGEFNYSAVIFVFFERFAFVFAIAIPFDIRDMKSDALAGRKTIPLHLGEKRAMVICNVMMVFSLLTAIFHGLSQNKAFFIPAFAFTVGLTLYCLNSERMKHLPLYYHGILDGSLMLLGLLISLSYFL